SVERAALRHYRAWSSLEMDLSRKARSWLHILRSGVTGSVIDVQEMLPPARASSKGRFRIALSKRQTYCSKRWQIGKALAQRAKAGTLLATTPCAAFACPFDHKIVLFRSDATSADGLLRLARDEWRTCKRSLSAAVSVALPTDSSRNCQRAGRLRLA